MAFCSGRCVYIQSNWCRLHGSSPARKLYKTSTAASGPIFSEQIGTTSRRHLKHASPWPRRVRQVSFFYHMMEYFEPVYHFLADLTPQVRAGATTHTVGEFAPFRLQISCMRMVPIDVDGDAPGAVHLTYSLAVDSKRWMCSGQIRGKIIMKPDDEGVIMEQAILLLPLVSGLLHLPTIKVHCEVDGDIKAIPVNNRHRAHQVRIFPQTSKPATTRLSVY
mmetsp:Transcript_31806/g.95633  ORF Transcript_31806/g.95633 Transcript_31806/m.95633 type:complete len:220 (+) Transcript_31806:3602-4261(+)